MRHQKIQKGLFDSPVPSLLPEDFDEAGATVFFRGSARAVEALTDADLLAPIDLLGKVGIPSEPEPELQPQIEGGGAKPSWSKGSTSTTTDTADTSNTGTKGGGRPDKFVVPDSDATDTSPTTDTSTPTTTSPDLVPEAKSADYVSGMDTPDGFNIAINFDGTWTESQRQSVMDAAELISDLVNGDLPNVNGVDDILITASVTSIDGLGGYWGWGGTTSSRLDSKLPDQGYLRLDSADMAQMEKLGLVDDFAFHEILHAMGFGTSWSSMGLVETINGSLRFTGENAIQAYQDSFPTIADKDPLAAFGVPVEMDGGSGTAGMHWDHDTFSTEMMTGTLNTTANIISDLTIAALEDMGYQTIYEATPPLIG